MSLFDVDDVARAIDQVHNVLVGWYDDKKKEWNEGIDTKLDKIGDALEQNIADQLVDIDRVLNEIERLLGDIEKH